MKKETLYTLGFLLLFALSMGSCKKDLALKNRSTTDSTSTSATISTLTAGYYDYITADNSGNVYAIRQYLGSDTIYKFDASGARSVFYVSASVMENDTLVTHTLYQLTIDTVGNLYTITYNGNSSADVTKINSTGTATTLFSHIESPNFLNIQQIAVNQGNFYFGDNSGVHKITADGTESLVYKDHYAIFTINRNGIIYYPDQSPGGQIDIIQFSNGTKTVIAGPDRTDDLNGAKDVVFGEIVSLITDAAGNIYIGEGLGNNAVIHVIGVSGKVHQLISTPFGHADGPLSAAAIGVPFSLATDSNGHLYFSELTVSSPDIRKISL